MAADQYRRRELWRGDSWYISSTLGRGDGGTVVKVSAANNTSFIRGTAAAGRKQLLEGWGKCTGQDIKCSHASAVEIAAGSIKSRLPICFVATRQDELRHIHGPQRGGAMTIDGSWLCRRQTKAGGSLLLHCQQIKEPTNLLPNCAKLHL
jgi:hypothetical protein